MKSKFLLGIRLWKYLLELPLVFLMYLAIAFSPSTDKFLGYYPLAVVLGLLVFAIPLLTFRAVEMREDEVRQIGLRTSRDRTLIDEGKTLIFRLHPKKRLDIELFGNNGEAPELSWMGKGDGTPVDITLFRGKAFGGEKSVASLLRFYGLASDEIASLLTEAQFKGENDRFRICASSADDCREIRVTFLFTPGDNDGEDSAES